MKYNLGSAELRLRKIYNPNGLEPQKKYYIIRRAEDQSGFFSNFLYVLGHMVYATKKGYEPVVDMANYKTLYNEQDIILGTNNAWEYYFTQKNSLEKAYMGANIILSDHFYLSKYVPSYAGRCYNALNSKRIHRLKAVFDRYSSVRPEITDAVDRFYKQKFNSRIVLGIHIRGTDMRNSPGHPAPPSVEKFISEINNLKNTYHIDCIFLCTDESIIVKHLKDEFGSMLYVTESFRAEGNTDEGIHLCSKDSIVRHNHRYLLGLEVLQDALLLSKCDYLIHGLSNVPLAAIIFNDNKYKARVLVSK